MTTLRPAPGVAVLHEGGTTYIARLPGGPIIVLAGVASALWTEACAGDLESLAARVSSMFEGSADAIEEQVDQFVTDLITRGLLEPHAS